MTARAHLTVATRTAPSVLALLAGALAWRYRARSRSNSRIELEALVAEDHANLCVGTIGNGLTYDASAWTARVEHPGQLHRHWYWHAARGIPSTDPEVPLREVEWEEGWERTRRGALHAATACLEMFGQLDPPDIEMDDRA